MGDVSLKYAFFESKVVIIIIMDYNLRWSEVKYRGLFG